FRPCRLLSPTSLISLMIWSQQFRHPMTPHYTTAMNSMRLCVAMTTVSALSFGQVQLPNRSSNAGSNACGPPNTVYIQTANETGGVPMFQQPAEVEKSFHIVRESTRNSHSHFEVQSRELKCRSASPKSSRRVLLVKQ